MWQSFTYYELSLGGFPSIRHNDITASLLTEVCHAVRTEPCLQPLSGEQLKYKTANDTDEARLNMAAFGARMDRKLPLTSKCAINFQNLMSIHYCSLSSPPRTGQAKVI